MQPHPDEEEWGNTTAIGVIFIFITPISRCLPQLALSVMGGLAALAREAGHRVTGCDANVYPPMSSQLEALDIELIEGFGAEQLELKPDVFVIGNVVTAAAPRDADASSVTLRRPRGLPQALAVLRLSGMAVEPERLVRRWKRALKLPAVWRAALYSASSPLPFFRRPL